MYLVEKVLMVFLPSSHSQQTMSYEVYAPMKSYDRNSVLEKGTAAGQSKGCLIYVTTVHSRLLELCSMVLDNCYYRLDLCYDLLGVTLLGKSSPAINAQANKF